MAFSKWPKSGFGVLVQDFFKDKKVVSQTRKIEFPPNDFLSAKSVLSTLLYLRNVVLGQNLDGRQNSILEIFACKTLQKSYLSFDKILKMAISGPSYLGFRGSSRAEI